MKDYYSLFHLMEELKTIQGMILVECFTQERNSLYLQFTDGNQISTVQFSAETGFETLFLRKNFQKSRSNFKDLFQILLGQRCNKIYIQENERIVVFVFGNFELWFILFGSSKTNAFVLDTEKQIFDSFLRPKEWVGKKIQEVIEKKTSQKIVTILDYLQKIKYFSKEICYHICNIVNLDCEEKLSELSENQKELLENKSFEISELMKNSKTFYVYFHNDKYFVAPIELPDVQSLEATSSISQAIYFCYTRSLRYNSAKAKFKQISRELKNKYDSLSKELERLQQSIDIEQRLKQYEEFAELLLSQTNLNKKGFDVLNVTTEYGNIIKIPLKKELTLVQNAEVYYQKIKKLKADIKPLKGKKLSLENEIQKIYSAWENLNKIDNCLQIEKFLSEHKDLFSKSEESKRNQEISRKFRRYEISTDAIVFVGKNARDNEELTFSFARPNDYWFHTRNTSGSHCVLRISSGKVPTKEAIKRAAQIAAYFSKARNSDYVPVSYTQRKFIRKPKRGETGSVVLLREEVIFVTPKNPEDADLMSKD